MISIFEKSQCSGCGACAQVCPKKCIEMCSDFEGFLYPKVDDSLCIKCNICDNICPIKDQVVKREAKDPACFVAYNKNDKVREQSSSGGIFYSLACQILLNDGVVFGAAFDDDHYLVHHVPIDKIEDLKKLQGSKYVQSRIENTYIETKKFLLSGKNVLFTGTPCQISGLKKYLKKDYDNLFLVDILCHGVPSPKLWYKYLNEKIFNRGEVESVSFRDKTYGWRKYSLRITFKDKTNSIVPFLEDDYMKLFTKNVSLRPSCYNCHFKDIHRESDLTLGDCWDIQSFKRELDDDKGISVVIVHTEKGKILLEQCNSDLFINKAILDEVLPPTADSRKSVWCHPERETLFRWLSKNKSMKKLGYLVKPGILHKIKKKMYNVICKNRHM